MAAATYDFTIEQYATLRESFTITDPNNNGALVDLSTGFTAHMQIRDTSNVVIVDLTSANGDIILGVGSIEIFMSASATGALTFTSSAKHDLLITNTGNRRCVPLFSRQSETVNWCDTCLT